MTIQRLRPQLAPILAPLLTRGSTFWNVSTGFLPETIQIDDLRESPKHMVFFLSDLVAVVGPATITHVAFYVNAICGTVAKDTLVYMLGLATALGLIEVKDASIGPCYLPPPHSEFRSYVRRKFFDIATERAKLLFALQRIDSSRAVLAEVAS